MTKSRNYENYLDYRRRGNTLQWVSRSLNPQYAFIQDVQPTPESHKEAVLNSPKVQEMLFQISRIQNVPKPEIEKQVRVILDEIGYNRSLKLIRWIGLFLNKICMTVCSGILVNRDKVQEVKAAMGNCPVIFLPSHRSYVDFILMSYVCFAYDVAIPAIAAGMDFHGMVGMGTMLRNTGAFFMRRTYNNDNLYWTTFRQYVYQLVTKGDLPIEFFIEGTRSRSNKSLMPKYGLLSMILKALFFAQVPDIIFVPINFSYDRIFEESLFAYELLGVPKPKESTSGFFKSLRILKESFGNIYISFDTPISAKAFFGDKLDRIVHNGSPLHLQELTDYEKSLMPSLAHEIVYRQQKSSIISVFNLMSVIISNSLMEGVTMSISQLRDEVLWLQGVMETFGAYVNVNGAIEDSIKEAFLVHKNLIELNQYDRVRLVTNNFTQDKKINPQRLKAHCLSDKTMIYSVPFVMLQLYVNATLHYLIDAAILVCILRKTTVPNKDELFLRFNFLRSLYLTEFVQYAPRVKTDFEFALHHAISLNVIKEENCYSLGNNDKLHNLLINIIMPFLDSYSVTMLILQDLPVVCDDKTVLANTQDILEKVIGGTDKFVHPYCLNLDTLTNCLNNLCSLKILAKSRRDNKNFYEINKEKLSETRRTLENYIPNVITIGEHNMQINPLQNKL